MKNMFLPTICICFIRKPANILLWILINTPIRRFGLLHLIWKIVRRIFILPVKAGLVIKWIYAGWIPVRETFLKWSAKLPCLILPNNCLIAGFWTVGKILSGGRNVPVGGNIICMINMENWKIPLLPVLLPPAGFPIWINWNVVLFLKGMDVKKGWTPPIVFSIG